MPLWFLEHGRTIERGTHDELIAKHGEYYQLYTGSRAGGKGRLCFEALALWLLVSSG